MSCTELLGKLSPEEKAALRLLIDLPGKTLDAAQEKFFSLYPWTGVILFPKNIETKDQVIRLIQSLQEIRARRFPDYPLFVAADQEGGSVSPLEALLTPSPGNMALAASGDLNAAYLLARRNGREMRELGFNVNFSPVVDVNINSRNPIIGIRSFGADPARVADFGRMAITGYQEEGVMATAKHFPGHGDTSKDSHVDLPYVDADEKRLRRVELLPFQRAVEDGAWGIMTAHVIFPVFDQKPATLSKKILTGLLREEMKFEGIIFTDSFAMAAIKEHYDLEEAVLDSVLAGADVLLALGDSLTQLETFQILAELIRKEKLPKECVDEPLCRILSFRKKLTGFSTTAHPPELPDIRQMHEKCVTLVKKEKALPLSEDATIFLTPEATPHLDLLKGIFTRSEFVPWPWKEEPRSHDWLFMAERRLILPECEQKLRSLAFPFECVTAFGNPYLLNLAPDARIQLSTFHFNPIFAECAYAVLIKGKPAPGKLPIGLP